MTESEAGSTQADLEALRALQADTLELERIEKLLDRFNVFETINFINDEEMHWEASKYCLKCFLRPLGAFLRAS